MCRPCLPSCAPPLSVARGRFVVEKGEILQIRGYVPSMPPSFASLFRLILQRGRFGCFLLWPHISLRAPPDTPNYRSVPMSARSCSMCFAPGDPTVPAARGVWFPTRVCPAKVSGDCQSPFCFPSPLLCLPFSFASLSPAGVQGYPARVPCVPSAMMGGYCTLLFTLHYLHLPLRHPFPIKAAICRNRKLAHSKAGFPKLLSIWWKGPSFCYLCIAAVGFLSCSRFSLPGAKDFAFIIFPWVLSDSWVVSFYYFSIGTLRILGSLQRRFAVESVY